MHSQMPQLTPEHRKLHAMAGSWTSVETLHPSPWDPKPGTARGRAESHVAMDGFYVVTDYHQVKDGTPDGGYHGHGVFGYDAAKERWFMNWFDNMGGAASTPVWGTWEGDTLTFQMEMPGRGHSRYVYRFEKDGVYSFAIGMSQDGKAWNTFMEGRFTRK